MRQLFHIVSSFLTSTFHKVVYWCIWRVVGSFITSLLNLEMKEFWKLVNKGRSYGRE